MTRRIAAPKLGPLVLRARKAFQSGQFDKARALALEAVKSAKSKKDNQNRVEGLSVLSDVLRDSKDTTGAVTAIEESIAIAENHRLLYSLCDVIRKRAFLYLVQSKYVESEADAKRALRIARDNGFGAHEADALAMIGHLCEVRKERPRALVWFREALKVARIAKHAWRESGLHHDLGRINGELQNYTVGLDYLDQGERLASKYGFQKHILLILRAKGDIYKAIGDTGRARELYERSFAPAMRAGTPFEVMENSVRLGAVNLDDGRIDEAMKHYRRGIELAKKFGYGRTILQNIFGLGRCYATQGEYIKAYSCFRWLLWTAKTDCANNLSTIRSALEQVIYLLLKLDHKDLARDVDELERQFKNLDDEGTYTAPQKSAMRAELVAQLPGLIQTICNAQFNFYEAKGILVNIATGEITVKGQVQKVPLTKSELIAFGLLFAQIGKKRTAREIHDAYAGEDVDLAPMTHRVHVLMASIRKKGIPKSVLDSETHKGYWLVPADKFEFSENFPE